MSLIIAFSVIVLIVALASTAKGPSLSYSQVRQQFLAENVKSFQWKNGILILELHKEAVSEDEKLKGATTVYHELADAQMFADELHEIYEAQLAAGIIENYNFNPVKSTPWYLSIIPYALVMGGLVFLMYFLFRLQIPTPHRKHQCCLPGPGPGRIP